MFIGTYYHTLEAKGRLAIPPSFRSKLKKGSVITRGLDGCLFVFPQEEWKELMNKLELSPLSNKQARGFVRLMTHAAAEIKFDSQGRTNIPQHLREYATLKKNVVVAGSLNRMEIWDRDRYHTYIEQIEKNSDQIAENLAELGI